MTELDIALKAVELYASAHPRPPHVNQTQAAEMLRLDPKTVRKLVRAGTIRLNGCGMIPIAEIDKVLAA